MPFTSTSSLYFLNHFKYVSCGSFVQDIKLLDRLIL